MSETSSVCEAAAVHNTTSGADEIDGFSVATDSGRSLHYTLYQCRKCGYQWAYFYDISHNKLERISVGEYRRATLYK